MSRRLVARVLLLLLAAAGIYAGVVVANAHSGLRAGQDLSAHQLWPQAREQLARYLWLHPRDERARMLMAEALVKDEALPAEVSALHALRHLEQIPGSSPLAAEARLQQARLTFLILQQPARAEQLLRQALEQGGEQPPVLQLLWTLLNATGRHDLAEPIFWQMFALVPESERPLLLREWYMSQFFPNTVNEPLDRLMGILGPNEIGTRTTESRRYLRFREREPGALLNHAALVHWCQQEGDPTFAARLLEAAVTELPDAPQDPFFLAARISVHLDLGQFDEAKDCLQRWPAKDRSFLYWKWAAVIAEEVDHQYAAALEAYDRALAEWPGPMDWRLRYRKLNCLARLNKAEVPAERERAELAQSLMTPDLHERLRKVLGALDQPEELSEIVDFYRKLGRPREATAWEESIRHLQAGRTPVRTPEEPAR